MFLFMKEAVEDIPAYLAAFSWVKGFFGCPMTEVTECERNREYENGNNEVALEKIMHGQIGIFYWSGARSDVETYYRLRRPT